jgi:hypothetical protein
LTDVDQLLLGPVLDGLIADAKIGSDLGDGATSSHQIEHLAAEFLGTTLGHGHRSFASDVVIRSQQADSKQSGHTRAFTISKAIHSAAAR